MREQQPYEGDRPPDNTGTWAPHPWHPRQWVRRLDALQQRRPGQWWRGVWQRVPWSTPEPWPWTGQGQASPPQPKP